MNVSTMDRTVGNLQYPKWVYLVIVVLTAAALALSNSADAAGTPSSHSSTSSAARPFRLQAYSAVLETVHLPSGTVQNLGKISGSADEVLIQQIDGPLQLRLRRSPGEVWLVNRQARLKYLVGREAKPGNALDTAQTTHISVLPRRHACPEHRGTRVENVVLAGRPTEIWHCQNLFGDIAAIDYRDKNTGYIVQHEIPQRSILRLRNFTEVAERQSSFSEIDDYELVELDELMAGRMKLPTWEPSASLVPLDGSIGRSSEVPADTTLIARETPGGLAKVNQ